VVRRLSVWLPIDRVAPYYVQLAHGAAPIQQLPIFPRVQQLAVLYHTLPSALACALITSCPASTALCIADQQSGYMHVPDKDNANQIFARLLDAIEQLPRLTSFRMDRSSVEVPSCVAVRLARVSCITQLVRLEVNLRGFYSANQTHLLAHAYAGLETLIVCGETFSEAQDLLKVDWARFTRLRHLTLNLNISEDDTLAATTWTMARLAQCRTLVSLDLSCTSNVGGACNSSLDALADLPQLEELQLSCQRMDVEAFARFCARSGISRLVLRHPLAGANNSADHAHLPIESLLTLRNLQHLALGRVYHFAQVQTLARLETLALGGLAFDHDVASTCEARLPRLVTLKLDGCIVQYKSNHVHHFARSS
jgi:hypothetical protein